MKGGAYFEPDPRYYAGTFIKDYKARDPEFEGKDILDMVIGPAHARGMKVFIELMEPFFKYTGHGSTNTVDIPNLAQAMEIDIFGRLGSDPSTSHPDYRNWILSMVEDQVRNYDIDGVNALPVASAARHPDPGQCAGGFLEPRPQGGHGARHRCRSLPPGAATTSTTSCRRRRPARISLMVPSSPSSARCSPIPRR